MKYAKWLISVCLILASTLCLSGCGFSQEDIDEAYHAGYGVGYDEGYNVGYTEGEGKGYDAGYEFGYQKGKAESDTQYNAGYKFGYEAGYRDGCDECKSSTLDEDASEFFIEIVSVTSPVSRGDYATLEARTIPDELLGIEVYYKSGKSEAKGLCPKYADGEGNIWWTWKVGTNTTPGRWKIVVASLNMDWWFKGYANITKTVYFEVE